MSSLSEVASSFATLNAEHPFPGLRAFDEADADWFSGRSAEINQLLKLLRRTRFMVVVGPSGCGKSSLIRAGLLPSIRDSYLDALWSIATFRPGETPLDNLAGAMSHAIGGDALEIRKQLDHSARGLVNSIRQRKLESNQNVFLLVDQFEELFQFARRHGDRSQEEAKAFLKLLLTSASEEVPFYLVITMRMEWLSECATYEGVAEAINQGIYLVPQMSRRQFQQTISNPIDLAGGSITTTLLDRMLNDLAGRSDQLPVLQHALMRLWICRDAGEPLDVPHYELVGTFSHSLSDHAEEVYKDLTPEQKRIAEMLFRSITQVYNNRKIRRPRLFKELAEMTGVDREQLKEVIGAFAKQGRSFLSLTEGPLEDFSVVDISHEALMRQWQRLTDWVDDEAEIQTRLGRLKEDAAEWDKGERRGGDLLWSGYRLTRAISLGPQRWGDSETVEAFLHASRSAERRSLFWRRWVYILPVLLLILVWQFIAYQHLRQAERQEARAKEAAIAAQKEAETAFTQVARTRDQQQQWLARLQQDLRGTAVGSQALAGIEKSISAQRVYMQYVGDDGLAKQVGSSLRTQGFVVPGYEKVASNQSPSESQVRYFHPEDKVAAAKIAAIVAGSVTGPVNPILTANPNNVVPIGQFEVWLDDGTTGSQH
jgi:hypothetical protein